MLSAEPVLLSAIVLKFDIHTFFSFFLSIAHKSLEVLWLMILL